MHASPRLCPPRPSSQRARAALICVALAAGPAACKSGIDPALVVAEIEIELSERAGSSVDVSCPLLYTDKVATCTATTEDGASFSVEVRSGPDDTWPWEAESLTFGRAVATQIDALYTEVHGIELGEVTCPTLIRDDQSARCSAQVRGVELVFDVTTGEDAPSFQPVQGFVVAKLAAKLAIDELAKLGVEAEVDCGPALRVSVPGETFTCTAKDATGAARPLYYEITGNDGQLRVRSTPPAAPAPAADSADTDADTEQ
ncbi:hypothetical protein [Haliangium ochraceum]|uniref:DUF4333 domain-containing protein n=1 Tax=Haliangium ochraceum (strain DSM 14365 / JCM 11303 / SMP-2) TaxID=502025 RepID=D0LJ54_HALO1|nr:hypothetical protein [Haliangium ochraceum]ACY14901.1 hypothetical protein Hoch_2363 [Haliangium ochraceum DSM 14365]